MQTAIPKIQYSVGATLVTWSQISWKKKKMKVTLIMLPFPLPMMTKVIEALS